MNSGHDVSLAITCFAGRPANYPHEHCEWLELQLKSQVSNLNSQVSSLKKLMSTLPTGTSPNSSLAG